jgi:tRNA(Arg) A34 adenosine deaminase TadA
MAIILLERCWWMKKTMFSSKRRILLRRGGMPPTTVKPIFSPGQLVRHTLYASTEPCAMCAGAIYWSRIGRVVYALSEIDLYALIGPSPEHLLLSCREVFQHSQQAVEVLGPALELEKEARAVHENFWTKQG